MDALYQALSDYQGRHGIAKTAEQVARWLTQVTTQGRWVLGNALANFNVAIPQITRPVDYQHPHHPLKSLYWDVSDSESGVLPEATPKDH